MQDESNPTPRRRRKRREIDTTVPSPCVAVCQYNAAELCEGCYRTPDEIRDWMVMTREEKLATWERIKERRLQ